MANDLARDAERSVIGACFLDGSPSLPASIGLSPGHFSDPMHARVFVAMLDLSEKNEPVDEVTTRAALIDQADGPRQGWAPYLSTFTESVPTAANIGYYARIVREEALRRDAVIVGNEFLRKVREEGADADVLISEMVLELGKLEAGRQQTRVRSAHELIMAEYKAIEHRVESKEPPGVPTCLSPLDNRLVGMPHGGLVIVAARPSMGKSALAAGIAKDLSTRRDIGVLLFSPEMTGEEQIQRLLANEGRVDLTAIRTGRMADNDWPKLARAAGCLGLAKLHIVDKGDLTIAEVRSISRSHAARHPIGCIVIDYLQLLSARAETREQEVSTISRGLKALAMELRLPVIALSQLNRSLESRSDKRPMLSDLRESGSLEQDAHQVIAIYRDDYYHPNDSKEPGVAEIAILKNRNGPTGTVKLRWSGKFTRFDPLDDDAELPIRAGTSAPYSAADARAVD